MNVHGFGNYDSNDRIHRPQGQPPNYPGQPRRPEEDGDNQMEQFMRGAVEMDSLVLADQHKVLFVSGRRSLKNPRE